MRLIACVVALALSCLAAFADPSDYSRTIAFGDSLSDNGNLAHNVPPFAGAPFLPGYFDGRFSNGPTWIELLSDPAKTTNPDSSMNRFWGGFLFSPPFDVGNNVNNVNAAIGGATATSAAQSIFSSDNGGVPSVPTQIAAFLAAGGTFGPRDLVSMQGGANDFFNFFSFNLANNTPPLQVAAQIPGFATSVGLAETGNVATVIGAGAKTILVSNLPNLGATPNFNGDPNSAGGGLLATVTYNTVLNQGVQQLAAANPSVNLIQMDWFSAMNVILANKTAFGFTDVTHQCFANPNCNQTTAQGFLFWDGVHPTEAAHELLAQYATLLLSTEETGKAAGVLGQVALSTRLEASDILFRRGAAPGKPGPGGLYAEVIGATGSIDGTNSALGGTGADYSLGGVRAGFDASDGRVTFGSALAYQTGSIDGNLLRSNLRATQGDVYGLMRFHPFFVGAEAGVSLNEYADLSRSTGFPTVNADGATRSVDYTAAVTLGSQYQFGGVTLTPAARIGYISVNIDGFSETAPILALDYGDHDFNSGFYTVRLRASSQLFNYTRAIVYGEVGFEDLFSRGGSSYTAQLSNNTAHGVVISDNDLEARGLFMKVGVGGYLTDSIKISGEYGLATQNGQGDVHSGQLRLTIPLGAD